MCCNNEASEALLEGMFEVNLTCAESFAIRTGEARTDRQRIIYEIAILRPTKNS
jgi:hypothetical protein